MIILGIDPGSVRMGYGVLEIVKKDFSYVMSGNYKLPEVTFVERLQILFKKITEIVELYRPEEIAIEKAFSYRNISSALKLGEARGALIAGASQLGAVVFEYEPRKIKQAVTGFGGAEKVQIQTMMQRMLHLKEKLQADEADALAVAYCHSVWR